MPLSLQGAAICKRGRGPDARFVAHLIATATRSPQTRAFARAAPEDAATSYSSVAAADSGLALSRAA